MWRSPVARLHGVQEAVGSNPITPTIFRAFRSPRHHDEGFLLLVSFTE